MIRIKEPVTKAVTKRLRVTKDDLAWAVAEVAKIKVRGPQPTRPLAEFIAEMRGKTGRPKVHANRAAKQKAYRERVKAGWEKARD